MLRFVAAAAGSIGIAVVAVMPDTAVSQKAAETPAATAKPIDPIVPPIQRVQPITPKGDPRVKAGTKAAPSKTAAVKPSSSPKPPGKAEVSKAAAPAKAPVAAPLTSKAPAKKTAAPAAVVKTQ